MKLNNLKLFDKARCKGADLQEIDFEHANFTNAAFLWVHAANAKNVTDKGLKQYLEMNDES